jgi:predicted SAM-dependent methyltransferase
VAIKNISIVKDIEVLTLEHYKNVISQYVDHLKRFPFVKALYQIGSVNDPGISDIDLIVVVDDCIDMLGINQLSVYNNNNSFLINYLFIHDIYLYNTASFKNLPYSIYFDELKLLYGEPQSIEIPTQEETNALALQIVFDFVSSRLTQFQRLLAAGRLGVRGTLVRLASIKYSYMLLNKLGIQDDEIQHFVARILDMRKDYRKINERELTSTFFESFYYFSRIVLLAAAYFSDHYLNFWGAVDFSNSLRLDRDFSLKFRPETPNLYRQITIEPIIYYPPPVFYHYLAYTETSNLLAEKARLYLSSSGGERYDLERDYKMTLQKRLESISDHFAFLKRNHASYAMAGHPGFSVDWDTIELPQNGHNNRISFTASARLPRSGAKDNIILDEIVSAESLETIEAQGDFPTDLLQLDGKDYENWVVAFFPDWQKRFGHLYQKKIMELYVTHYILAPEKDDTYMDVAGGLNTYTHRLDCRKKFIQSILITDELRETFGDDTEYIQSDAASIPLPDASVSKMSCHHSFEHFQAQSDSAFVKEAQRLLRPGGKCCIVPIFIGNNFVEVTRITKPHCHYDKRARYVVDPTARLTGGESCGDYARIYDISSFQRRVFEQVDREKFDVTLLEIMIDGKLIPDMTLSCHFGITRINYPYRVLTIEKKY